MRLEMLNFFQVGQVGCRTIRRSCHRPKKALPGHQEPGRRLSLCAEYVRRRCCQLGVFAVMAGSPGDSPYYQNTTSWSLWIAWRVRQKMFQTFMDYFQPGPEIAILDVGVTSNDTYQESNYFEPLYPYPHRITCVGTEDVSHVEARYAGLRYQRVEPSQALPFDAGAFDIVFSSAVIEHVGDRVAQASFVRELCRVGRGFCVTTPNRWFPMEHHSGLPLVHLLLVNVHRSLLRHTRYRYWTQEENLNMLSEAELAKLFPQGWPMTIKRIRIAGVCSNLVAKGKSA